MFSNWGGFVYAIYEGKIQEKVYKENETIVIQALKEKKKEKKKKKKKKNKQNKTM